MSVHVFIFFKNIFVFDDDDDDVVVVVVVVVVGLYLSSMKCECTVHRSKFVTCAEEPSPRVGIYHKTVRDTKTIRKLPYTCNFVRKFLETQSSSVEIN